MNGTHPPKTPADDGNPAGDPPPRKRKLFIPRLFRPAGGDYENADSKALHKFASVFSGVALSITFISLGAYLIGVWRGNDQQSIKPLLHILFAGWVVIPPIWFWYEYYFMWAEEDEHPYDFEQFTYGQTQARNMWLALTVILAVVCKGELVPDTDGNDKEPLKVQLIEQADASDTTKGN